MLRTIGGVLFGLALLTAYLLLCLIALPVVIWRKLTGTEPEVELTGTEDDPY